MAAPSPQGEIEQSIPRLREAGAIRTGSAVLEEAVGTLPCSTRDRCWITGDQSKKAPLNRSKADRVDSTPGWNSHGQAIARWAQARAHSASRIRPKAVRAPKATTISKPDRKSTRLNSSHQIISYAVFCLKKKKK